MGKELSEMSLEELWELFSISFVEHNIMWDKQYEEIEICRAKNRELWRCN